MTAEPAPGAQKPRIAFVGLGMMGLPMAGCLLRAGYAVAGADLSEKARDAFSAQGGTACADARTAVEGAGIVITMLPDGKVVRAALLGADGVAEMLPAGTLVIDMSSSAPLGTAKLGAELAERGLRLVDAPVSGGVRRAVDGSLAIMAGGDPDAVEEARPVLSAMGRSIFATGPLGSGHAMKALNNYVSAAGLLAACEALAVAQKFGIAGETVVDVLNASTGKNNSTEVKLKPFVLSGTFASGFSLALMAKDLRTAADLGGEMGLSDSFMETTARIWEAARGALPGQSDHTEIYRFIEARET
ncbi:NAD(P)-dependent oxidoreductase [Xanthobacter sediminis]